jgi:hypothetical protein
MSFLPNRNKHFPPQSALKEKNITIPYIALIVRNLLRGSPNDALEAVTNATEELRQEHPSLADIRLL